MLFLRALIVDYEAAHRRIKIFPQMRTSFRDFHRAIILLIASAGLLLPQPAAGIKIKIKVKKPRVTVGKPKIHVPRPDQVVKNVTAAVEIASRDAGKALSVAVNQTGKATGKAAHDVVLESGRIPRHLVDVGDATIAYLESYKQSALSELEHAQRRFEEGKLVDLMFHTALAPLEAQEEALFRATQESGWVNSAGSVAAGAYGGPYGAAAYAAWQTYRLTDKNPDLAIRAGVIAGLTSAAMGKVSSMDGAQTPQLVKKSILAGAVGGLAVAASGGEEGDVKRAIVMGSAMVLLQNAYKSYVGHDLNSEGATKPPYCITEDDPSCNEIRRACWFDKEANQWRLDTSKLDTTRAGVGIAAGVGTIDNPKFVPAPPYIGDNSPLMQGLAQAAPAFNGMSFFHDKWVVDWKMTALETKVTIIPAIALTYVATGAPLFTAIHKENAEEARQSHTLENRDADGAGKALSDALHHGAGAMKTPNPGASPVDQKRQESENATPKTNPPSVWEALKTFQDSLPEQVGRQIKGSKVGGLAADAKSQEAENATPKTDPPSVWEALTAYQSSLAEETDAVVAKNSGTEKVVDGVLKPKINNAWVAPTNPADFRTRKLHGIVADSSGRVQPEAGWEWTYPDDPSSMEVNRVEGLESTPLGELQPKEGWDWADPNNPTNLTVIKEE